MQRNFLCKLQPERVKTISTFISGNVIKYWYVCVEYEVDHTTSAILHEWQHWFAAVSYCGRLWCFYLTHKGQCLDACDCCAQLIALGLGTSLFGEIFFEHIIIFNFSMKNQRFRKKEAFEIYWLKLCVKCIYFLLER